MHVVRLVVGKATDKHLCLFEDVGVGPVAPSGSTNMVFRLRAEYLRLSSSKSSQVPGRVVSNDVVGVSAQRQVVTSRSLRPEPVSPSRGPAVSIYSTL